MTTLRSLYSTEPAFGAYSKSVTTAFTIPALSATATQAFDNVTWVSMGQAVFLSDSTNYGYFTVTGIDSELGTLILENTWGETNGSEIAIDAKLSPAGVRGVQGIQGIAGNDGADGSNGSNGTDGKSAYEIAVEQGFIGDVNEWLVHITGTDGVDGADGSNGSAGLTAYEVAINNGFVGTEQQWLDSLVGPQGEQGIQGIQGIQGVKGDDGESAYDVAVRNGYSDSEPMWLDSLVGSQGLSAYEVAVSNGFVGTEQEWLTSLEYDSDGSTNAYTTAEKDKLAGIATGAEVNVNADWNAVSGDAQILNKPTLGTAAATNSTDYATSAQGALADTALQPTETETVSGDYTFNGALYLPNNSRINNIEHFYQTTKPTTRGDSSALVAGDRWWKTDDGTEWFWNGTYWLSVEEFSIGSNWLQPGQPALTISTGSFETEGFADLPSTVSQHNSHLFLTDWVYECRGLGVVHDETNYFTIELSLGSSGSSYRTGVVVDTKPIGGGGRGFRTYLGLYFASQLTSPTFSYGHYSLQRVWLQGYGSRPGFRFASTIYFRKVAY